MWYPENRPEMRKLYRTCATARLFIPKILPYDSVIYIDVDTLFMRPPEDLWREFENYDKYEIAGLGLALSRYYPLASKVSVLKISLKQI